MGIRPSRASGLRYRVWGLRVKGGHLSHSCKLPLDLQIFLAILLFDVLRNQICKNGHRMEGQLKEKRKNDMETCSNSAGNEIHSNPAMPI